MKKHTEPLRCENFYHIYNRGINGENLFKDERNYKFFLGRYEKYIEPVAYIYAWCLLRNHFHLLIRTRSAAEIIRNVHSKLNVGRVLNPADVILTEEEIASKLISHQFSVLFNSYAQAINKSHNRTGGLLEEPFRRIQVNTKAYCCGMVHYIHTNPQKHRFVEDFRDYPHSSYHAFLSDEPTILRKGAVLAWFGGLEAFKQFHLNRDSPFDMGEFEIEID